MSFRIVSPLLVRLPRDAPYVFFFALFPVYFVYHALLNAELLAPVLGGGWSVWTLAGVLVLGPLALLAALQSRDWHVHIAFALLAAWVAIYAIAHALFGAEWQRNPILLIESGKLICGWGCLYAIGYLFRPDPAFVRALLYALGAMTFAALFVLDPVSLHYGPATYQGFATSIVFAAMFCLALVPMQRQPAVLTIAFAALFTLGSRSDFCGFIFVACLWCATMIWQQRYRMATIGASASQGTLFVTAALTGVLPFMWAEQLNTIAPLRAPSAEMRAPSTAMRQLEMADVPRSQSWKVRMELLNKGWADIKANPVLGHYGGQMRDGETWGSYIHSALSMWRQFGLVPFIIYMALCTAPAAVAAWQVFVRRSADPMWLLTFYIGGFTLLLVLATKAIFWPLPALAWGLVARMCAHGFLHANNQHPENQVFAFGTRT